jgi:hypothetical protein
MYVVGIPFLHSFASMLIGGAGRDAERVARHIVRERTSAPAGAPGRSPNAAAVAGRMAS